MIDQGWKNKRLPEADIQSLTELLNNKDDNGLQVYGVNGDLIRFDGWVAIPVNLPGNEDLNLLVSIPFQVSSLPIERPLGFNVVEEFILGR